MSLKIITENKNVLLVYSPSNGTEWIDEIFNKDEKNEIAVKRTFTLSKDDLLKPEDINNDSKTFIIGNLEGDYYLIFNSVLNTKFNVLIHNSFSISIHTFIVNSNISILSVFENLANQQIIIGGDKINAIPNNIYKDIINSFPTKTELNHYVDSRVTNILSQYLEGVKDSGNAFERYLGKRKKINVINSILSIKNYEYEKYLFILEDLKSMLEKSDNFSENDWQKRILEIILILYPKYIRCFSEVEIKDFYTNPTKVKNRYIDLMLVDSNGNVDVIEIKRPFENCIITKNTYRDNYTPLKELSGTIMQVEKYLFHLNKWGVIGEKNLTSRYENELPKDLIVKITNPKGIVIMGRDNKLSNNQKFDFEIIKRKYSNVMDIITYDDLIKRLDNIIDKFKQ